MLRAANNFLHQENDQTVGNRLTDLQLMQRQSEAERKTITTVEVHQSVCPPAPPPPLPYKWPAGLTAFLAASLE